MKQSYPLSIFFECINITFRNDNHHLNFLILAASLHKDLTNLKNQNHAKKYLK
jgi:hypothetical protein